MSETVNGESALHHLGQHVGLATGTRRSTVDERRQAGRATRTIRPRGSLGEWTAPTDRKDPIAQLLAQEQPRVPELLPIRHARMAANPFAFYRGAAVLMASDLGALPTTGLVVQACGDAHMSNFGLFASPDRSLVFDVNDFDETHPAPFEWDVARLATSFELASQGRGLPEETRTAICQGSVTAYRRHMRRLANMNDLDIWYERVSQDELLAFANAQSDKAGSQTLTKSFAKARARDRWSAVRNLTVEVDGTRQFLDQPPLLVRVEADGAAWDRAQQMFQSYRRTLPDDRRELLRHYHLVDIAHKVVGVGSVGLLAFVILLQGRDANDLLVLQVKQAVRSVLEPYTAPSHFGQQGHRVVAGQRLMQASADTFLGWVTGPRGREYYVRQLRDMKWSPDPSRLGADDLRRYAAVCGWTLARAHARTGDAVAIDAYLGTSGRFDRAMARFAQAYARQSNADYDAFMHQVRDHRIAVAAEDEIGTITRMVIAEKDGIPTVSARL